MTAGVLVAIPGAAEAELVSRLDAAGTGLRVVRRCADVPEVLAAGLAGLGELAVMSVGLPGVDRTTLTRLHEAGVRTVLLAAAGDEPRCLALGAAAVLDVAADPARWATALAELARAQDSGQAAGEMPPAAPAEPTTAPTSEEPAAGPGGRIVTVWGPRGSPGRTSIAVNLSHELAQRETVLLVDADTEAPSVAQVLGLLDESAGIAAAARLAGTGRLAGEAFAELCPPVTGRLRLLSGLTRAERWRELPVAALEVVWEQARQLAAWTVIDTAAGIEDAPGGFEAAFGPRRHQATLSALAAADVVVVVGAGEPLGMHRLVLALQELADAGVTAADAQQVVVVNRVRAAAAGAGPEQAVRESLARFAGVSDAVLVPDERASFDRAVLRGTVLAEVAPTGPALGAVHELAGRVTGRPRGGRRRRFRRRHG